MTLNPNPIHPAGGAYVLRLHRDARPAQGLLIGRIQHVASGDWSDFASSTALLDWLSGHAATLHAAPTTPPDESAP
jgi:hypothetical protein